jgi:L-asparaginase II
MDMALEADSGLIPFTRGAAVEVWRGGLVESYHEVSLAVEGGRVVTRMPLQDPHG